jgi:hypothetical protein
MQDPIDGTLKPISWDTFLNLRDSGATNIVAQGDVFKIRGCFFRVVEINGKELKAAGITRREYIKAKAAMPLSRRVSELPDEGV